MEGENANTKNGKAELVPKNDKKDELSTKTDTVIEEEIEHTVAANRPIELKFEGKPANTKIDKTELVPKGDKKDVLFTKEDSGVISIKPEAVSSVSNKEMEKKKQLLTTTLIRGVTQQLTRQEIPFCFIVVFTRNIKPLDLPCFTSQLATPPWLPPWTSSWTRRKGCGTTSTSCHLDTSTEHLGLDLGNLSSKRWGSTEKCLRQLSLHMALMKW